MNEYKHAEAYCLMKYASHDESIIEVLWNSRDGVTPFGIPAKNGTTELFHVDWEKDRRVERFLPHVGMRIFVDMSRERLLEIIQRRVEIFWNHPKYPMAKYFPSKEAAVSSYYAADYHPGMPEVVEVTIEMRDRMRVKLEAESGNYESGLSFL